MLPLVLNRLWAPSLLLAALLTGCSSDTSTERPSASAAPSASEAAVPGLALPETDADPREVLLARSVSALLSQKHLLQRSLDDEVSEKAFAAFLDDLDGGKLFLLAEHVTVLEGYRTRLDDDLRLGNLRFARQAEALVRERRKRVAAFVAKLLEQPLDLQNDEELETDPEKLTFAKSEAELEERWRMVLELQVLERIGRMEAVQKALAEGKNGTKPKPEGEPHGGGGGGDDDDGALPKEAIPDTPEGREKKAREELATTYQARFKRWEDSDPLEPAARFINAIVSVYDPHTTYLAPATQENFEIEVSGSLEGIGAALTLKDHFVLVSELVPGGASWQQGKLEAGDLILAVAQEGKAPVDVTDMPLGKVVKMIRGPKGTVVSLTVKKPDGRVEVIAITRDVVKIEAAYARGALLELDGRLTGYINLPSFYGNTRSEPGATGERNATDDVRALLVELAKRKASGVIIDLRGNGGGLLAHARDISGLLIPSGPVVQAKAAAGELTVYADEDPSVAFEGDVIVMVDRFSASASEILAGALQDYERAIVVGTGPTHGKGTVQVLMDLDRMREKEGPPLGVLKITTQQYFRVDGESTQSRGVIPDIVLPDPAAHIESGERFLKNAIPWSETEALSFQPWTKSRWNRKTLIDKSKERVAGATAFEKLSARAKLLSARQKRTVVPLAMEAWRAERDSDIKALEAVELRLNEGPPRFQVTDVTYGDKSATDGDDRIKKRLTRWRENLGRDPWLEEALRVMADMHVE